MSCLTFIGMIFMSCDDPSPSCGALDHGPCFGNEIDIDIDSVNIQHFINIPDGILIFSHIKDVNPPLMVKLDSLKGVAWARQFDFEETELSCFTSMRHMDSMTLIESDHGYEIHFLSDKTPATIYLDSKFDFRGICFSPNEPYGFEE